MTVAPNGVSIADYDVLGIGSLIFAGVKSGEYTGGNLAMGQDISGTVLRPAGLATSTPEVYFGDLIGQGTWRCLGALDDGTASDSATLFMRVA